MSAQLNVYHASTWLSNSKLRNLRGSLCALRVFVKEEAIETRSSSICSLILNKYGLVNHIPYETIVSVDLKDDNRVELIFNPDKYLERKLNIYTDSADKLVDAILNEMCIPQIS